MVEKMEMKDLLSLSKLVHRNKDNKAASYSFKDETFSYDVLKKTLDTQINELVHDFDSYRENGKAVFKLIEKTIDDVLPMKVEQQWGQFAEIQQFAQGDRPVFTQKITTASKKRAKQFITKVGLAGIYEVFKLDGRNYEVPTSAFGGACQIALEEFLDNRIRFSDVYDIVMEGLDEIVYVEIEKALKAAINALTFPKANKISTNTFNEKQFDRLLGIVDSYGSQGVIYCTFEFAATMIPTTGWVSESMKDELWTNGYFANYKHHRVIVLPQSYTDTTHMRKVIDPSYCWIMPTGTSEKPVKIALEGQTIVDEYVNYDRSREIQVYKKMGVGAILNPNVCVYQNTSLKQDVTLPSP